MKIIELYKKNNNFYRNILHTTMYSLWAVKLPCLVCIGKCYTTA